MIMKNISYIIIVIICFLILLIGCTKKCPDCPAGESHTDETDPYSGVCICCPDGWHYCGGLNQCCPGDSFWYADGLCRTLDNCNANTFITCELCD